MIDLHQMISVAAFLIKTSMNSLTCVSFNSLVNEYCKIAKILHSRHETEVAIGFSSLLCCIS